MRFLIKKVKKIGFFFGSIEKSSTFAVAYEKQFSARHGEVGK